MTHEEFIDQYLQVIEHHIKDGVLYVDNDLNLYNSEITSLPEKLYITGHLHISKSNITSLPKGLYVGAWLSLQHTKIIELPEGLSVSIYLELRNTEITSLPEGLSIDGLIYSDRKLSMSEKTQLSLIQQNEEHFKVIKNPTENTVTMYNLLWKL